MKSTLMTAGIALALGVVWTAGPALAQQTTGEKIENKAEKAGDKMERAADKAEDKTDRVGDKTKSTAEKAGDKVESAWDKTKAKTRDLKDKVKAKTTDKMDSDRMHAKSDVTAMQRALKNEGHDPGPIDGVMGPRTKAALMEYQRKEGLPATGRWDDETASKLGVRMSKAPGDTTGGLASPADPADVKSGPSAPTNQPGPAPEPDKAPPSKRNSP